MSEEHKSETKSKRSWYDRSYKILFIAPFILLIIALIYLFQFYQTNGDLFHTDVSIKGGTTITVFAQKSIPEVEQALKPIFPDIVIREVSDFRTGEQKGFYVETIAPVDELRPVLEDYLGFPLTTENSSIEFTGSTLSSSFYSQLRFALITAFIFMAVVVFLIFRTFVPSFAVILSAFANIVFSIFVIDLIGLSLSLGGIVALLMLIGYSVDTDIMLTTRVLRSRHGTVNSRIAGAFKTGIVMTLAAIAAVAASLFFTKDVSNTLGQIFTVLLIGLFLDVVNTWMTNASLLKWYAERRNIQ